MSKTTSAKRNRWNRFRRNNARFARAIENAFSDPIEGCEFAHEERMPDKFKFVLLVDASLPTAIPATACFMVDGFAVQGQVERFPVNRVLKWAYMPKGK